MASTQFQSVTKESENIDVESPLLEKHTCKQVVDEPGFTSRITSTNLCFTPDDKEKPQLEG